jgi:citrate synthase
MESSNDEMLSARAAAERLGVKRDTLYAYVSRGLLHSVTLPGSRERHYRAVEVERFRLGRGGDRPPEALMPVIDSAICLIENGHFHYRGHDAVSLAETASLEDVARLLWDESGAPAPAAARPSQRQSRPQSPPGLIERCQIRLALLAAEDMTALDLGRAGVARTGWRILLELAGCVGGTPLGRLPVHEALAARWRLDAAGADLVRRCLVLLADHELNASTFVARCVASTGATPYAVVAGALSALSGRRHGGAAARVEALLHEIKPEDDPLAVMAARLARGDSIPSMGQPLYPDGDPRALAIVAAITRARPTAGARSAAIALAAMQLTGQAPNVDFALAAAVTALELPAGAALGLFIVARTVGWIAHAIEQYDSDVLIRPRARYTGLRPA